MNITNEKPLSLIGLTWPIFIEQVLMTLITSIDTFMLSSYSDNAVAAVGVAAQIIVLCQFVFGIISMGLGIVLAQLIGAKRQAGGFLVADTAMGMSVLAGLAVMTVLVLGAEPILSMMQLDATLMQEGVTYLRWMGVGSVFMALTMTTDTVMRMHGYVKPVLLLSAAIVIMNIIGNYIALFGPFGLPVFGVKGVAIATVIARVFGVLLAFWLVHLTLSYTPPFKAFVHITWSRAKMILRMGLPSAGENISYNGSQVVITALVTMLGTTVLITKVYAQNLTSYVTLFASSLAQATAIMVGYSIGAGRLEEAYKRCFSNLKLGMILALVLSSALYLCAEPLLGIFTKDPEVIQTGKLILLLSIFLETIRTINIIVIHGLNAAGDVKFPVLMGLISMWGVSVPVAYVLGIVLGWGVTGIWCAFIADELVRGVAMIIRWRSRRWQRVQLITDK
jgi:putative MATE family efflux protein